MEIIHLVKFHLKIQESVERTCCTDCQSEAPLDTEIVRQDLNCNWDMIEPFVEGKPEAQ